MQDIWELNLKNYKPQGLIFLNDINLALINCFLSNRK